MRVVRLVAAPLASAYRLLGLTASSPYRSAAVSSFASRTRPTSPLGPMVGFAKRLSSRPPRLLRRLARWERS
jgi:hypothetical protein